jgi:hypothetical protein
MMHGHHDHCAHEMAYCSQCDVAYCRKCSREWGRPHYWTNTTTWQGGGTTYQSQGLTAGQGTGGQLMHNHSAVTP